VAAAPIDVQTPNPAYFSISRLEKLFASKFDLTLGDRVVGHGLRDLPDQINQAVVGLRKWVS
jgi:hypothetical protein